MADEKTTEAEKPKAAKTTKSAPAKTETVSAGREAINRATEYEQSVIDRNRERYDARQSGKSMAEINEAERKAAEKAAKAKG